MPPRPIPSLDHENHCPHCHQYLPIKFAVSGRTAGHHYIGCGPVCKYFHSFPHRDTLPTVPHDAPPASWRPPSSSAPARSMPSASTASTAGRTENCQHNSCGRKAAPTCVNHRCKTHCIVDNGGCLTPGHQQQRLTTRQQQKHHHVPTRTPPASSRRSSDPWLPGLSPIIQDFNDHSFPTINLPADLLEQRLRRDAEEEEARDQAQDAEIQCLIDNFPPLTDEERADQEAADLALAVVQSKRTFAAESRSSRSAPHASTSTLPSISGALRPIYSAGKEPASASSSLSSSVRPKMTTQMSASWMREYRDNTAADAASLKQATYKSSLDLSQSRRFTLVFWTPASENPSIKSLQDLPRWPLWAVTDSPYLITRLGIDVDILELYDTRIRLWKEIDLNYTHKLSVDAPLFLRIPGTLCPKLDELVNTLTAKPVHLRDNLAGDRRSVRQKIKVKQETVDVIEISEDDSPKKMPRTHKRKALDAIELTDSDDDAFPSSIPLPKVHMSKRPKLTIDIPDAELDSISSTSRESSAWPRSRSSTPATTPLTSTTPSTCLLPLVDSRSSTHALPTIDLSLRFPKGLMVKEVTDGFERMVSPELQKLPMAQRFVTVYKRPWVKQTYLDAVARCERANETERQQALAAADDSPLGMWTTWARGFPLRK
ncbi:hypothetical protein MVEN_00166500 [Mycena venus]|uniref:Uncharacterized protein n=1 Tax=Mycena venus TaxID=2733690 RepID=A0A8H6Z349_9AGAR|nr:hypothetical protein MVEN_00166500 [Mycena venus]